MPNATKLPKGVVLYEGPSRIDGAPIVAIATGLARKTVNPKTGDMIQTWIIRSDMHPVEALQTGADVSICGGCVHRPKDHDGSSFSQRSCYVNVMGPSSVYRSYASGKYPKADAFSFAELFGGRMVRLGSYGDPAAVPVDVWQAVVASASGHTGYTHQWRSAKLRDTLSLCQLSADSVHDIDAASALGVGYFRVLATGESPKAGEIVCPASSEAGYTSNCADCGMCSGANGAPVVISAHGAGLKHYAPKGKAHSAASLAAMRKDRKRIALPVVVAA